MLPEQKLNALVARHAALERDLTTALPAETYVKLSREFAELAPVVEAVKSYRDTRRELDDLASLIADPSTDAEMRSIAESEKPELEMRLKAIEEQLRISLLPKDAMDERNVILEIRAGTGGDEAALFAGNLFRMYERYAAKQGWKVEVVTASEGAMGGFKEIIAEIRGRGAFAKLKYESGVHRVQRVPDTEASGRIHTSAATVAVLPEAQELDVAINDTDLKIDTLRSSGAGGQHVNKTESAVRITHLPSGIVVTMQEDRSQHRNRAKAMAVLRTRLYDFERQKQDAARAAERRGQVGTGDRSERIRTYNYPQARVSDHRINLTLYKLPQILEGEALGEIIDALGDASPGGIAGGRGCQLMRRARCRGFRIHAPSSQARRSLAGQLHDAGIESPELDARILIGHALGLDHAALAAAGARRLGADEEAAIAALIRRRLAREPVARIIGHKEFWSLPLRIDAATLVPRPEIRNDRRGRARSDRCARLARSAAAHCRSRYRLGRARFGAVVRTAERLYRRYRSEFPRACSGPRQRPLSRLRQSLIHSLQHGRRLCAGHSI